MTAAAERGDKFTAEYVPPPPPAPGKILVRAPLDGRGHPVCPDLHLTPERAEQLRDVLDAALMAYMEYQELSSENELPALGTVPRPREVPELQDPVPARHGHLHQVQGRLLLQRLRPARGERAV